MSAAQREITLTPGFIHPQVVDGKVLWLDSGIRDLVHKMHYGDPVIGWEGDPRLAIYLDQDRTTGEDVWTVERLESDGVYRTVCRSRPGLALDERLLLRLMEHDTRRGFDPASLEAFTPQEGNTERDDQLRNALEKAYWCAANDLGEV